MPQIASAKKRVRTSARQTEENSLHRARSRTAMKKVRSLLAEQKVKEAAAEFATAQTYLDKAAKVRAFHPNTTSRYKARLSAALKTAGFKEALPARAVIKPSAAKVAPKRAKKTTAKTAQSKSSAKSPSAKTKSSSSPAKPPSKKASQ